MINSGNQIYDRADVYDTQAIMANPSMAEDDQVGMYMLVLFLALLELTQNDNDSVLIHSKVVVNNSEAQSKLNKRDGDITFVMLKPDADESEIEINQNENAMRSAAKDNIRDAILVARQSVQAMMNRLSTDVSRMQSSASENSELIKKQNAMSQSLNEMNQAQ